MFSLTLLLRRAAQINGRGLATSDGERRATWREFRDHVGRFAGGLAELGVRPGDRVAILALNSDRYYAFYFSVAWAGGVFVPVNTRLAPPEIVFWLNDSGARVLFVDSNFAGIVPSIRNELETVESIVYLDDDATPEGMTDFSTVANGPDAEDQGRADDDLAGLFYTGGTTGRSKGVMLSHKNLVINAMQAAPIFELMNDERALHAAPMFHAADWVICMAMVSVAGENYFVPGFEPVAVMEAIQQHAITRLVMVPTMVNMVVNHPDVASYDLSSLRHVLYGASPMPQAVIQRAMEVLPKTRFVQAYGQTETSPILTMLRPEHHATKLESAGQALPGVEIKIVDEDDNEVPLGEIGEVCARGPNVMLGYRNMEEQTATTLRNGWIHTGDGGYMDDEGFIFIVDRMKDMIVSGGENVYSAEVENAVHQHPAVAQCAVIGIPHAKWGEQVHAIVLLKEGESASEQDITDHCHRLIANYKCPRSIEFTTKALPLSGAGKILKTELRKPHWEGRKKRVN